MTGHSIMAAFRIRRLVVMLLIVQVGVAAFAHMAYGKSYANESAAIGNLRAIADTLQQYRALHGSYPDNWQEDLYASVEPDLGQPMFNLDLQTQPQTIQGYNLQYTPQPSGCQEPSCTGFVVEAVPAAFVRWWGQRTRYPNRSFYLDESGIIRHCIGITGAAVTDRTIAWDDQPPEPCRDRSGTSRRAP